MRQRISYDSGDYAGSVIIWIILIGCFFFFFFWDTPSQGGGWGWNWWWWILIFLGIWWIFALCFTPTDVYADDDYVRIRRPFKTRKIRMDEIESAEPYKVSKNPRGKFLKSSPKTFGHWGHYNDDNIGDYFAYYGKPDHTVLIKLKNGKKYVVGGSDSKQMSDYINSKINKNNS